MKILFSQTHASCLSNSQVAGISSMLVCAHMKFNAYNKEDYKTVNPDYFSWGGGSNVFPRFREILGPLASPVLLPFSVFVRAAWAGFHSEHRVFSSFTFRSLVSVCLGRFSAQRNRRRLMPYQFRCLKREERETKRERDEYLRFASEAWEEAREERRNIIL